MGLIFEIIPYSLVDKRIFDSRIVGSVVECSPATRAARVRFPDDAECVFLSDLARSFFLCAEFVGNLWHSIAMRTAASVADLPKNLLAFLSPKMQVLYSYTFCAVFSKQN